MSGWVHVERMEDGASLLQPSCVRCGCTTPTPDPASPCGYVGCEVCGEADPHERSVTKGHGTEHEPIDTCHPHQPTRCICGHPIEERA